MTLIEIPNAYTSAMAVSSAGRALFAVVGEPVVALDPDGDLPDIRALRRLCSALRVTIEALADGRAQDGRGAAGANQEDRAA